MTSSKRSRYLLAGLAALLAIGLVAPAVAGNSPWFPRVWQTYEGLPGDNVTGVLQSREGFLWVATQNGLARFDGIHIQDIPLAAPLSRPHPIIRGMLLDHAQRLWLAEEGAVLVRVDGRKTFVLNSAAGLQISRPLSLVEDSEHAVWLSYVDGSACRIIEEKVVRFMAQDGLAGSGPCLLATDQGGRLWFAKAGWVGVFRNGRFEALTKMPDERYFQIFPSKAGGVWICTGGKLYQFVEGREPVMRAEFPDDAAKLKPSALFEDNQGGLWIGTTANGLFHFDGEEIVPVDTSHPVIECISEDREGNIWVGTGGGGLNRIRQRVVELQNVQTGVPFESVRSVCEDAAGAIWVVLENGAVARLADGVWQNISTNSDWARFQATCVAADKAGALWFGTYRQGILRWQDGRLTVYGQPEGVAVANVRAMLPDSQGNLWIGFETGGVVQQLRDGRVQNYQLPSNARAVRAMAEDAQGRVWLGTVDGTLLRVEGDKVVSQSASLPQPSKPIRCLSATPDGSLWLGFATWGVGRLKDGKFCRIDTKNGLADYNICAIASDEFGRMWFGGDHGIFYAPQRDLDGVADGGSHNVLCIKYGRDDALPSLAVSFGYGPVLARGRDGRLLFPLHSGLAIVRPQRVQSNRIPPLVRVVEVLVDDRNLFTNGQSIGEIQPSHRKIEIKFTASSFIDPEKIAFRYQLVGWDADPVPADSFQRSVQYLHLPAGKYEFFVSACNGAGVWNPAGATVSFVVRPFFWQTLWFAFAAVAFFTLAVVGVARYVSFRLLRRRLKKLEQETALQRERARIAQDIHDDLGASLTQIKMLGELVQQDMAEPERAQPHAEKISATARQSIKSLDEIVWAVNPRNDTLAHLLDYIGQFAVDFLNTAGLRCRIDFPPEPFERFISSEVRHNLFLVVKEGLNNIVRHARATEAWVRVKTTADGLLLVIEDNGRGMQNPADAWPDGLPNMKHRLAAIGGELRLESRAGEGTKISIELPWPKN